MVADLKRLREQIRKTDDELLKLIHRRNELAKKVGIYKLANNLPIKNFQVEKDVMKASRAMAKKIGLYEDMAEDVAKILIHYSVKAQEDFRSQSLKGRSKQRKKIAIVGGLGKMGQWLARFFESFGHQLTLYDSPENLSGNTKGLAFFAGDLSAAIKNVDIVILATPMSKTAGVIETLIQTKTDALIFDICSLKSPVLSAISKAEKAGLRITSVHPMFGPDVNLLSGRNIILCETKNKKLANETEELFKDTAATILRVPLEKHDELMSYVLGLSHMVNLSFAKVLSESSFSFKELKDVSSSTFSSQLNVTAPVVSENQNLYYEIQAENTHSSAIIEALIKELQSYLKTIKSRDREAFKAYMEKSRRFMAE